MSFENFEKVKHVGVAKQTLLDLAKAESIGGFDKTSKSKDIADAINKKRLATSLNESPQTPDLVAGNGPKAKLKYFRNYQHSALTIMVEGEAKARFTAYNDTFKGDPIRIGFLETSDPVVIARCQEDMYCEEISESEYNKHLHGDGDRYKPLKIAAQPIS